MRALLFASKTGRIRCALVAWIVQDVDFSEIGGVLQQSNVTLLVFAFGLYFLGYFLTAVRWRLLISIHRVQPPLLVLVQSFMVGIFFNNFLPSTIGGDVSRMYDVWRIAKDKSSAVSVVLVDRFLGVTALILWGHRGVAGQSGDSISVHRLYSGAHCSGHGAYPCHVCFRQAAGHGCGFDVRVTERGLPRTFIR